MTGEKCTRTGLWMIALNQTTDPTSTPTSDPTTKTTNQAASTLHTVPLQNGMTIPNQTNVTTEAEVQQAHNMVQTLDTSSKEEIAKFHHQALGSPPVSTLL